MCADLSTSIPHEKLLKSMKDMNREEGKENVIVISTGSLCPVHLMHLEVLECAIDHLEKTGKYNVLAGYLSPSHDIYVSGKLGNNAISSSHRVKMVEILCQNSEKISVSSWEANEMYFVDYPQVVHFHKEYFNRILPKTIPELLDFLPIRVIYVCGSDHAIRCSLLSLKQEGVVVVSRPGIRERDREKLKQHYELTEKELLDISSTKIRACIKRKQPLEELCGPNVSEYLYKLYSYPKKA